jgi:putative aldouronate transport system permease protein
MVAQATIPAARRKHRRKSRIGLVSMLIPGSIALFVFSYIPMLGIIIAFKDVNYSKGILGSDWIGWKNFQFLFKTPDAWTITRNTVLYNLAFIVLGTILSVSVAIALDRLRARKVGRFYQAIMFLPYFFSWIVVSTLVFSFLSVDMGLLNRSVMPALGLQPVNWYTEVKLWPFILVFVNLWRYTGYNSVIYLASIAGIDPTYHEAAAIDGATTWQQIRHITIPLLMPVVIILTLLAVGRIFFGDFGLFYQVPLNMGPLFKATNVIDTYVYRTLVNMGDIGMSAAAGLYQSVVGFILVLVSNLIVRKIDPDKSLF